MDVSRTSLLGRRLLIVEDEFYVAMDLAEQLRFIEHPKSLRIGDSL
jgi:hypothetical protein